jgi:hypothetical protein
MIAKCTSCGHTKDLGARVGFKLGLSAAGLVFGASAAKHPAAAVGLGVLGGLIGHALDTNILPNCPSCGVVLQLVSAAI